MHECTVRCSSLHFSLTVAPLNKTAHGEDRTGASKHDESDLTEQCSPGPEIPGYSIIMHIQTSHQAPGPREGPFHQQHLHHPNRLLLPLVSRMSTRWATKTRMGAQRLLLTFLHRLVQCFLFVKKAEYRNPLHDSPRRTRMRMQAVELCYTCVAPRRIRPLRLQSSTCSVVF